MPAYDDFRAEKLPLTVAFFEGNNCGPCKTMKPIVSRAAAAAGLAVRYFNAADERATVLRLGLRSVPTVVLVGRDAEVILFTGVLTEEKVYELLAQAWVI